MRPAGTGSARAGPGPGCGTRRMDLRQPGVDRRVARDQARRCGRTGRTRVPRASRCSPTRHQPRLGEVADVQLDVRTLYADQRVQAVGLAPGEPASELVGVQRVGMTRGPGQVGNRGQLARLMWSGWNGIKAVWTWPPRNGLSSGRTRGPARACASTSVNSRNGATQTRRIDASQRGGWGRAGSREYAARCAR